MKITCVICLLGFYLPLNAQIKLSWQLLSDVKFESVWHEEQQANFLVPTFGEGPSAFEGKEVLISGYFIPLSEDKMFFVLSANPYASCYFCGAAGPESIVEIWFKPQSIKRFKLDQFLTLKGKLKLNKSDVNHCNYILEEAEEY
jgi:hypothetical protein